MYRGSRAGQSRSPYYKRSGQGREDAESFFKLARGAQVVFADQAQQDDEGAVEAMGQDVLVVGC